MKTKRKLGCIPTLMMGLILVLTYGCQKEEEPPDKITDKDGNVYTSVTIGTQVWLVENLKTTKYNDGTSIPNVTDGTAWDNPTGGAYCWYQNDISNKNLYGGLYNASTVTSGKLCPLGWHVPTHSEWQTLVGFAGGNMNAGGKLKETGTTHWNTPNTGATDEFGFKALPGGWRSVGASFINLGNQGIWWTSTPGLQGYGLNAWDIETSKTSIDYETGYEPRFGMSVRCIKD